MIKCVSIVNNNVYGPCEYQTNVDYIYTQNREGKKGKLHNYWIKFLYLQFFFLMF